MRIGRISRDMLAMMNDSPISRLPELCIHLIFVENLT